MRRRPTPKRRCALDLESLERRLAPAGAPELTVPLDPMSDRYGDQIVAVQAYQDTSRTAFSIFDTGASALTFSARDQGTFTAANNPIPIKVPGGAHGEGFSGTITGDVSEPNTILAAGLNSANISLNSNGLPGSNIQFGAGSAAAAPVQAFVGTTEGSPNLPTLTGTPILYGGTKAHPGPYAALVDMQGAKLDFSSTVSGLALSLPELAFVEPGYQLSAQTNSTAPLTIPMTLVGTNDLANPGNSITETGSPVQTNVTVGVKNSVLAQRTFLFDTGAQVTVISTRMARLLGLDLAHPLTMTNVSGANGSAQAPGFVLDKLDLPLTDGNTLEFTNVPISVLDVASALDGILGMNLWNSALQMLYVQTGADGAPSLTVTFQTSPAPPPSNNGTINGFFNGAGFNEIGGANHGDNLPGVTFHNGQINGVVWTDYNSNGAIDPGEMGLPNEEVYLDLNQTGTFDLGDPAAFTDASGHYQFSFLAPGSYTVRELPPSNMAIVSPQSDAITVQVQDNASVNNVNFGDLPIQHNGPADYVTNLYGTVLDRPADAGGLNGWMQLLSGGTQPRVVAAGIWQSAQHIGQELTVLYQTILHRQPDAAGLASWTIAMANGASISAVEGAFLNSSEYTQSHGDVGSFILGLYHDVLGRNPDAAGAGVWVQNLGKGMTRAQVIKSFLTSDEFYLRNLDTYYFTMLHRQADQAGEQAWLLSLKQGASSLESVAEGLLSSREFMAWVQ